MNSHIVPKMSLSINENRLFLNYISYDASMSNAEAAYDDFLTGLGQILKKVDVNLAMDIKTIQEISNDSDIDSISGSASCTSY